MLRLAPWSFATATVQGALIAAAPGTPENPNGTSPIPLVPLSMADPAGSTPSQIVSWLYEYAWPRDCVRLRQVKYPCDQPGYNNGVVQFWPGMVSASIFASELVDISMQNRASHRIAMDHDAFGNRIKVILSNIEGALIIYTAFVDDPDLWDDEFSEAFTYYLGAHLTGALIGDKQVDKAMLEKATMLAAQARAVDANEQPSSPNHTPDWIRARGPIPDTGISPYPVDDN